MSGRNTKISPKRIKQISDLIAAGNYANIACQSSGISEATFYNWLARGQKEKERMTVLRGNDEIVEPNNEYIFVEFLEAVKKAEADAESAAVIHVRTAMATNWQAAMTYLERKFPDRWGRRDTTKNVNVNMNQNRDMDLSKLSDEELFALEDLMLKANPDADSVRH